MICVMRLARPRGGVGLRNFSSRWHKLPDLPYLNNKSYLDTLEEFSQRRPVKSTLVVWGPKSVTKSGGLQRKIKEWRARGDLVIDINLKGKRLDMPNFVSVFAEAVDVGLESKGHTVPKGVVKQLAQGQLEREATIDRIERGKTLQSMSTMGFVEKIKMALILFKFKMGVVSPGDMVRTSQSAMPFLRWITRKLPLKTPRDIVTVVKLLEEVAKQTIQPPIRITVVIREIQELDAFRSGDVELGKQLFDELFLVFQPRKEGESVVPFILETSDFLWAHSRDLLENRESFSSFRVKPFPKDELRLDLVERTLPDYGAPIFTQEEFEKVWEYSGGHQGTVYTLFDRLTAGESLEEAMSETEAENYGIVQATIVAGSKEEVAARDGLLKEMVGAPDCRLPTKGALIDPAAHYLLKNNILFFDGKHIAPQHAQFAKAIEEYVGRYVL